jgi:hypothetical protein
VPDAAIQTDQARKIVLTVGKDGTVAPSRSSSARWSTACASSAPA